MLCLGVSPRSIPATSGKKLPRRPGRRPGDDPRRYRLAVPAAIPAAGLDSRRWGWHRFGVHGPCRPVHHVMMVLANIFQPLIDIFGPVLVLFHSVIGGSWG